jgi:hypothetical protein
MSFNEAGGSSQNVRVQDYMLLLVVILESIEGSAFSQLFRVEEITLL